MGTGWNSLRPFLKNWVVLLCTVFPSMFYVIKFSHFILFVILFINAVYIFIHSLLLMWLGYIFKFATVKFVRCFFYKLLPLLSRNSGTSWNTWHLPDGVSDASAVGQPWLWGQPIGALREVWQGPHRPITQARASCASQRAIAPAQTNLQGRCFSLPLIVVWHCFALQRMVWECSVWTLKKVRVKEEAAKRVCAVSKRNTERVSLAMCCTHCGFKKRYRVSSVPLCGLPHLLLKYSNEKGEKII